MNKKIIAIAAFLVIGAAASLLMKPGNNANKSSLIGKQLVDVNAVSQIRSIVVSDSTGKIELELLAERWLIKSDQGFWADSSKVSKILDDLSKNKIRSVMPSTKNDDEEYGLGQGTIITLGDEAQKELVKITAGDRREKGGQFLRIGADKLVFLSSDNLSVSPDIDDWEDRRLFDAKPEYVKSVQMKKAKITVEREKSDDEFAVKGLKKDKLNSGAVKSLGALVQSFDFSARVDLSNVEAIEAIKNPKEQVEIVFFDGSTLDVVVGQIGDAKAMKSFAKLSFKPAAKDAVEEVAVRGLRVNEIMDKWYFEIPQYSATKFLKTKKDFLKSGGS